MANKYHNRKVDYGDLKFDSTAEFEHYLVLKDRAGRGEISGLKLQPIYMLQEKFHRGKDTYAAITYRADFQYVENGIVVAVDVKGVETEVWRIKRKLFLARYPNIQLLVVKV